MTSGFRWRRSRRSTVDAEQGFKRRQQLEAEIEDLQLRRSQMAAAEYSAKFQQLLLQSAELGEQIDSAQKQEVAPKPPIELPPIPEGKRVP